MPPIMSLILFILGAYLLGSIPFGYLIAKSKGIDIRKVGSGNIGATNVGRALGKRWKFVTIILDALKGALAVIFSRLYFNGETEIEQLAPFFTSTAAIMGHNWTIFLKFKGGKGVATSAGVITFLSPYSALASFITYLTVTRVTKYVSLGSMVSGCVMAITMHFVHQNQYYTIFGCLLATLIIAKHHTNIKKLIKGEENKIGNKA